MDHTQSERQAGATTSLAQWLENQIQNHNLTQAGHGRLCRHLRAQPSVRS